MISLVSLLKAHLEALSVGTPAGDGEDLFKESGK